MQSRLLELDALRGIAALSVVLFHYTSRYHELYVYQELPFFQVPLGHYGVQLFFVVSGFVIFLTLNSCKHPYDFIVSRFARLYPVYWAAIALTCLVVANFGLAGREVTLFEGLFNLTMLQGFFGIPNVDGVYWTLKWELVFYFWMFMIFIFRLQRFILPICMLWLASQVLVWGIETYYRNVPGILQLLFLIKYCNLFVAGIIFYRIKNGIGGLENHAILALCLFNQWLLYGPEQLMITVGIFTLFYLFSFNRLHFIAIKPLVFLGTISYSLYLIHEYVGWIFIREMLALGFHVDSVFIAAICLALCLATALTYGVEKPAIKRIRGKYKDSLRDKYVKQDIW